MIDIKAATPKPDAIEIGKALDVLCGPDAVVELRAIHKRRKRTDAGYFDGDHWAALVSAAVKLNKGNTAVYITLNPIDPQLLSRYNNRIEEFAISTATDANVTKRRWLLVDIDPVRPKDTAATDAQLEQAKSTAREIFSYLKGRGWPDPVVAESGNGMHLLYRVDLPNDDQSTALIKGILIALADKFDTATITIDKSVFNAARVIKLHGTVSTKGDHTPGAPWRLSKITTVPDSISIVSPDQLQAYVPVRLPETPRQRPTINSSFNLEDFLSRLAIPYQTDMHTGRERYKLDYCPFNQDHGKNDAAIFRDAAGVLGFKCLHNGCADKSWQDVRALVDGPIEGRRRVNRNLSTAAAVPETTTTAEEQEEAVDNWQFEDAEIYLHRIDPGQLESKCKVEIAKDILTFNDFDELEHDFVRDFIKRILGLNKGAQDKLVSAIKKASGEQAVEDERTHAELAADFVDSSLHEHSVGCDGAIWEYSPDSGLYKQKLLQEIGGRIGDLFNGDTCKRGNDYKQIATLVYNKQMQPDFFKNTEFGIATLSHFIRLNRDGQLDRQEYTPEHRARYKFAVDPLPGVALLFSKYLFDSFAGPDQVELITMLQEVMGGLITGTFSKLQRAILLIGPGENGKSVFLEIIENLFPPDSKAAVPPFEFEHEYYRAQLAGKIINIVGELDRAKQLRASFKDIVGCDTPISARVIYQGPFSFTPVCAHVFASNYYPQTHDHTHGFYRRWQIIPFDNRVSEAGRVLNLGTKIIEQEMAQVLEWALIGAQRFAANGFKLSCGDGINQKMVERWKTSHDSAMGFLADDEAVMITGDSKDRIPKKLFYQAYSRWAVDYGRRPVGVQEFYERISTKLKELQYAGERRSFVGVKLL